jgi:hypothetical protein
MDNIIGKATIAVVVSWVLLVAAVAFGLWREADVRRDQCRRDDVVREEIHAIFVDTFNDLGTELGADENRVSIFTGRIDRRFDDLPDPC